jgi:hypothetical protein
MMVIVQVYNDHDSDLVHGYEFTIKVEEVIAELI